MPEDRAAPFVVGRASSNVSIEPVNKPLSDCVSRVQRDERAVSHASFHCKCLTLWLHEPVQRCVSSSQPQSSECALERTYGPSTSTPISSSTNE